MFNAAIPQAFYKFLEGRTGGEVRHPILRLQGDPLGKTGGTKPSLNAPVGIEKLRQTIDDLIARRREKRALAVRDAQSPDQRRQALLQFLRTTTGGALLPELYATLAERLQPLKGRPVDDTLIDEIIRILQGLEV